MALQKEISDYLNGKFPLQRNSTQKNLKDNIIFLTGEEEFQNFTKSYKKFYGKRKVKRKKIVKNVNLISINKKDPFLKPLKEFREFVLKNFSEEEILGAYVHGSLGDGDYIRGYSDFDALFIIRKEVLENKKKLSCLRKKMVRANTFLYLLDPLQHHGFFIISEMDMKYYLETIFPLILFNDAKEITNYQNKLIFNCLEESTEFKNEYEDLKKRLLKKINSGFKFYERNSAHMKLFVQGILLLPATFLQYKNKKYFLKKNSFKEARKFFNKKDWEIIERCTQIRKKIVFNSRYSYSIRKFIGMNVHYKVLSLIHRYFDHNNFKEVKKALGKNYDLDLKKLLEKMEEIPK